MQRPGIAEPPMVHAAHVGPTDTERRSTGRKSRQNPIKYIAVALAAVLVLLAGLTVWYQASHGGRVYQGVKVLNTDVSGLSRDEARASITSATVGYPPDSIRVAGDGRDWTFSPADIGLAADVDRTVDTALAVGRTGNFVADLGSQVRTLFGGARVTPSLQYDPARLEAIVARIAADVDRPAVDSRLEKGEDGVVRVTPSSVGSLLDREALRSALAAAIAGVPIAEVSARMVEDAPEVTEAALQATHDHALLLTEQSVVLKSGETAWAVEPANLRGMLTLDQSSGSPVAALDGEQIAAFLGPIAEEVYVAPVDASVTVGRGEVTMGEEADGSELDVPAAVAAIQKAATAAVPEERAVTLPMKAISPAVHNDQVRPVFDKANSLVTEGMRLYFRDDGYILRGTSVTGFIDVAPAQGGPGPLQIVVDEDVLANRVAGVAGYINRPTQDSRFRMVNGAPTKVAEARDGLKVDVAKSVERAVAAIEGYAGGDRLQVELDTIVTPPTIVDADLSNIQTPHMLAYGQTSYATSSANRAHNVELGTSKINGELIPPGGIFSTSEAVGDLTLAAGYKMGFAIVGNGQGGLTTVPAEAGGICQVSTTLFHAVFRGGLEIVERNWHSYWISTYGQAPTGLRGLDATIAPPYKDFRFKNNTGNWILVKATWGKPNIRFELWGTNPGWSVQISDPVITNIVKTSQAEVVEYSSELPASSGKVRVEYAQDGFTSSIHRVVADASGNVIDDWSANSRYQPARNRFLIGTGR
ncbi:MAG TPA: peptidoglycan binding domain-containing protein [Chloroflexia bacterium]|nr:peptidoglycan binding domain-containing protein [Chloroflexia bacterium]